MNGERDLESPATPVSWPDLMGGQRAGHARSGADARNFPAVKIHQPQGLKRWEMDRGNKKSASSESDPESPAPPVIPPYIAIAIAIANSDCDRESRGY